MTDKLENYYKDYKYGDPQPMFIKDNELTDTEKFLLTKSKYFCIVPWIHLHAFPDGRTYPCCLADMDLPVGSMRTNTMEEIWHNDKMNSLRDNMVNEKHCNECTKCYEQEHSGFISKRQRSNKAFGQHIKDIDKNEFKLRYYDVRFSNLCNFSCRTCGDIFSSNWVKEAKQYGWVKKETPNVSYAGRFQTDAWEQLLPHIDYLEEIYFAGGEPLIMEEHYRLLKELLKRGRNNVRIVYNTNFSELAYKGESVLNLWNEFETVSVGASLDASHKRAELMRYGTKWTDIIKNREQMLKVCPTVNFYISATLSVMNVYHLPEFHKEWIDLELIRPMDFNVNILQSSDYFRIDILPKEMKEEIIQKYNNFINYLEPIDDFSRAVTGYRSALNYMIHTDNTHLIPTFVKKTRELDRFRNERFFDVFPELKRLEQWTQI